MIEGVHCLNAQVQMTLLIAKPRHFDLLFYKA